MLSMASFIGALIGSAVFPGLLFWAFFQLFLKRTHASIISSVSSFCLTSIISVSLSWFGSNSVKEYLTYVWMYPFWTLIFMYIWLIFKRLSKANLDEIDKYNQKAISSFIIGLFSMIAWLIPLIGLPLSITGLVFGFQGRLSTNKGMSISGIVLGIVGIILSLSEYILGLYSALNNQS